MSDPLDEFVANAALRMRERLAHGARKFGITSWRDEPYTDDQNHARLLRAVEHLWSAVANEAGSAETAKRAADVANQAFMYADPHRYRHAAEDEFLDRVEARNAREGDLPWPR